MSISQSIVKMRVQNGKSEGKQWDANLIYEKTLSKL